MTELEGKKLRDYSVTITGGEKTKLSKLSGKKGMILYFYPKDATPGCTKQACSFRDHYSSFKRKGYSVVGVSADSPESHQKFTDKQSLNFPLIADTDQKLSNAVNVWVEKNMYGKKFMGIVRTTFIVDESLKIIKVFPKVKVDEHIERLLEAIA